MKTRLPNPITIIQCPRCFEVSQAVCKCAYRSQQDIAWRAVEKAVARGELIKPSACEECLESRDLLHAHHDNYELPLEVRWLCRACHKTTHPGVYTPRFRRYPKL